MIRRLLILIMLIAFGIYGYFEVNRIRENEAAHLEELEETAAGYEEKGYYKEAMAVYSDLYKLNKDKDLEKRIAFLYYKLGDDYEFKNAANNYLNIQPDEELYVALIEEYLKECDYKNGYKYLETAYQSFPDSKRLRCLESELDGKYTEAYLDMDEIILISEKYIVGKKDNNIEICDLEGQKILQGFDIDEVRGLYRNELKDGSSEYIWFLKLKDGVEGYLDNDGCFRASVDECEEVELMQYLCNGDTTLKYGAEDIQNTAYNQLSEDKNGFDQGESILISYKEGDLWGYKNQFGYFVIEPQFEEASEFISDGYAVVKDSGAYSIISLYRYQKEESLF